MKVNKSLGWLMVFMTALFGTNMQGTDLRGDSMNYAAISNNVLSASDPLILTLNGELYMNKPPLFFWANALFIKLFGASPFSVKIATLLAVLMISYFLYKIAMELFDDENTALLFPLLFFTTYIIYKNTHMLKMEAFVTAFMIGAVYYFIKYLGDGRMRYVLLTGVFSGLAVFAKGPLGLVPLIGAFIYPFVRRESLSVRYFMHFGVILLLTLAVPGWWFAYVMQHTPFYETFFLSQMVDRMGNNSINTTGTHYFQRPVYAYLGYIFKYGGLFLLLFPYGLYRMKKDGKFSPQVMYFTVTAIVFTIIIHFITTREHRYLYQFYLFFWLAGAYGLGSVVRGGVSKFLKYGAFALLFFIAVYPGRLNWSTYGVLQDVAQMAEKEKTPIVARPQVLTNQYDRAAVSFYLKDVLPEPPKGSGWIEIRPREKKMVRSTELFRTRELRVYAAGNK